MNNKRFSKVLLVILLVLAFATTNAVEAIQFDHKLSPDPANKNNSFGSVTSLSEADGSITGIVTDGTKPLNGILVEVYRWTGSGYDWSNLTTTDASGNYDVGNLSSGIYRVQFSDMAGVYFPEYYDNAPDLDSATDISVTTGSVTSGIDAVLAEGGTSQAL
ncbi:MAG: hypothetical protein GWP61_23605 [Chloroflexi bacterium]|jgi:hypothetical protein|nr:hypothetical protein [Chloroflexota bacterium]